MQAGPRNVTTSNLSKAEQIVEVKVKIELRVQAGTEEPQNDEAAVQIIVAVLVQIMTDMKSSNARFVKKYMVPKEHGKTQFWIWIRLPSTVELRKLSLFFQIYLPRR